LTVVQTNHRPETLRLCTQFTITRFTIDGTSAIVIGVKRGSVAAWSLSSIRAPDR
jgi:hypothetical protein